MCVELKKLNKFKNIIKMIRWARDIVISIFYPKQAEKLRNYQVCTMCRVCTADPTLLICSVIAFVAQFCCQDLHTFSVNFSGPIQMKQSIIGFTPAIDTDANTGAKKERKQI